MTRPRARRPNPRNQRPLRPAEAARLTAMRDELYARLCPACGADPGRAREAGLPPLAPPTPFIRHSTPPGDGPIIHKACRVIPVVLLMPA